MAFPSLGDYNGHFVHPRIAVGGCMRAAYVPALVEAGVRGIVNMTGVLQKSHLAYLSALPDSIHWQLLGTWDGVHPTDRDAPASSERLDPRYAALIVEIAMRIVRDCSPVLIHCGGGISRSGNVAAIAVAALEGVGPDEAIERMRAHRPKLADFSAERWALCDVPALLTKARAILAEPAGSSSIHMMP